METIKVSGNVARILSREMPGELKVIKLSRYRINYIRRFVFPVFQYPMMNLVSFRRALNYTRISFKYPLKIQRATLRFVYKNYE